MTTVDLDPRHADLRRGRPANGDDRSLGEVLSDLSSQAARLVDRERRLIKLEAERQIEGMAVNTARVGVGAAVGFVALQVAAVALVALLALWMPLFLAAALVAVVLTIVAFMLTTAALRGWRAQGESAAERAHELTKGPST